ncbi:MAG TPA: DUF1097 domain-containing protein [Polyangiaceae bacterium]|nr:DUF1097 domain-containing protein [Polyangiaceae bacterium]
MKKPEALSVSIGVLGAVDTFVTATLIPVPVWVTFIAWASFVVVGGGRRGWVQSLACNGTGIVIASLTLLVIALSSAGAVGAAVLVGLGSAAMVQASKVPLLAPTPAIVWGFASLVGTTFATGVPITTLGLNNPLLVAALAMLIGASFGFAAEAFARVLEKGRPPAVVEEAPRPT